MGPMLLRAVLLALLLWLAPARDPEVLCRACRALMDEVEYDVTKARQTKTKVPLALSEAFLADLLDQVCQRTDAYTRDVDPATNEKTLDRFAQRTGDKTYQEFKKLPFYSEAYRPLKFARESTAETYEEQILSPLVAREARYLADRLRAEKPGLCENSPDGTEF